MEKQVFFCREILALQAAQLLINTVIKKIYMLLYPTDDNYVSKNLSTAKEFFSWEYGHLQMNIAELCGRFKYFQISF